MILQPRNIPKCILISWIYLNGLEETPDGFGVILLFIAQDQPLHLPTQVRKLIYFHRLSDQLQCFCFLAHVVDDQSFHRHCLSMLGVFLEYNVGCLQTFCKLFGFVTCHDSSEELIFLLWKPEKRGRRR